MRNSKSGFTLLEVMLFVAVFAILAYLGLTRYQAHLRRTRRAEATTALLALQQQQERYRASHPTYGSLAELGGGTTSPDGRYTLSISSNTPTGYTATATAVAGTDQLNDSEGSTSCSTLSLNVINNVDARTPAVCW